MISIRFPLQLGACQLISGIVVMILTSVEIPFSLRKVMTFWKYLNFTFSYQTINLTIINKRGYSDALDKKVKLNPPHCLRYLCKPGGIYLGLAVTRLQIQPCP